MKEVAFFWGLDTEDIKKKTRKREIVTPRQCYHYFARKYFPHIEVSLTLIGQTTSVDHATVIHSVKSIENLIETDKRFKLKIQELDDHLKTKVIPHIKKLDPREIPANRYQRIKDEKNRAENKSNRMYYEAKKILNQFNEEINKDHVIEGWRRFELEKKYWDALKKIKEIKEESTERLTQY